MSSDLRFIIFDKLHGVCCEYFVENLQFVQGGNCNCFWAIYHWNICRITPSFSCGLDSYTVSSWWLFGLWVGMKHVLKRDPICLLLLLPLAWLDNRNRDGVTKMQCILSQLQCIVDSCDQWKIPHFQSTDSLLLSGLCKETVEQFTSDLFASDKLSYISHLANHTILAIKPGFNIW